MERVFRSKVDSWLLLVLLAAMAACLYAAYESARAGGSWPVVLTLLAGVGLPAWLLASTRYLVSGNALKVTSGPFSWHIDIDSITSVRETHNPLSSPALSLDRLEIHYGRGQSLMISPKEKRQFLVAIGHAR
ncbi:hypothetical protein FCL40_05880 [Ferrimonas sediminicola]|uniref:Uncharacterized protein YyaB-like PH domain-containing protein n=1 Tax=Ferrimonas sediminicola TaxID=2569538 RepID=A0A4U1BHW8_9GAMM|nr:PH domain-containing protein [Ferrimonas sediminicola]TKB50674.1 hypothetical protein FCL40_05880 [Ferrimonas sediminicola]